MIYLLVDWAGGLATSLSATTEAKAWMLAHAQAYDLRPQPFACSWVAWVDRWLETIAAKPVQATFVESLTRMTEELVRLPKSGRLKPIVIC